MEKETPLTGEESSYDFGARIYNPVIGRWMSVDKVVKPNLSSYQFGSNNGVIYIDKSGNDEFYFNLDYEHSEKVILKDGTLSYRIPMYTRRVAKQGMHRYFYKIGEDKTLTGTSSVGTNKSLANYLIAEAKKNGEHAEYKNGTVYTYSITPKYLEINSPMSLKGGDGKRDKVGFSSVQEINFSKAYEISDNFVKKVRPSGSIADPFKLLSIKNASGHTGFIDFKHQLGLKENVLYSINGVAYNKNEAGNFFWGYVMAKMNFSKADVELFAHEGTNRLSGGKRSYDEPWELDAIMDGFNFYWSQNRACGDRKCETENIDMYKNPVKKKG